MSSHRDFTMQRRRFLQTSIALSSGAILFPWLSRAAEPDRAAMIDKAYGFLKGAQNKDGSWAAQPKVAAGVTGVVVAGLLKAGKSADDPIVAAGLKYIESLVDPKEKHIAGAGAANALKNYCTSINVMALQLAGRPEKYKAVVGDAAAFLKQLQWDDGEQKTAKDDYFGGAGYDSKSRPDLSNTQFFLDALKAAGVPGDDPAYKKALVFVSRCQNFKSEANDQPWAGAIDDGTFIYTAAQGGSTRASDDPKSPLIGYGSMTYAGVKSMIYCGVGKDDSRVKKALVWLRNNYTVDANPGMPPALAQRGLYYYYQTMAKTLDLLGADTFEDARNVKHDWRADLTAALAKRQAENGSWANATDRWMEGDPALVTGYALLTLGYCKK